MTCPICESPRNELNPITAVCRYGRSEGVVVTPMSSACEMVVYPDSTKPLGVRFHIWVRTPVMLIGIRFRPWKGWRVSGHSGIAGLQSKVKVYEIIGVEHDVPCL